MPKRSKEDTEITIQKIMDAVVDQLLRWDMKNVIYYVAQQTGVSKTGIIIISLRKLTSQKR